MREVVGSRGKQSSQDKGMLGEETRAGVLGIFYSKLLLKKAEIASSLVIACKRKRKKSMHPANNFGLLSFGTDVAHLVKNILNGRREIACIDI